MRQCQNGYTYRMVKWSIMQGSYILDWLIVGGGIQGTHLSLVLSQRVGVPHNRIRVLDTYEEPLAQWHMATANTGMHFLRSTAVHHLDLHPKSLIQFADQWQHQHAYVCTEPYQRPALALFNAHTASLIAHHRLDDMRLVGRATALQRYPGGWRVETTNGGLEARHVILAIGGMEHLCWPDWSKHIHALGAPVQHIFAPGFRRADKTQWRQAVIVGGGISGVQTALTMAQQQPNDVVLLSRYPLNSRQFDVDECWTGRCLKAFLQEPSLNNRRDMINRARFLGTVPPELVEQVYVMCDEGMLRYEVADVVDACYQHHGMITLTLAHRPDTLATDCLIFATGFDMMRPGGVWLDDAIAHFNLPCAACGYPVVDHTLAWAPGLYVVGPLAELEIGPIARSIAGARFAGKRIAAAASML